MMQEQDMSASAMNPETTLDLVELGRRLKQARIAQSLEAEDISQQLHLPLATVADLEAGRSDRIGTPVYLKGFLRSYLKVVRLPEEWAELALSGSASGSVPPILPAAGAVARRVSWLERYKWAASYVVGTGLALTAVHWLVSNTPQLGFPDPQRSTPSVALDTPPAPPPAAAISEPTPATPANGAELGPTPVVPEAAGEELPVMASLNPFRVPGSDVAPSMSGNVPLTLSFDQASWVEVRDQSGRKLAFQTVSAGETRSFSVGAPFSVLIGNARGVRADVAGTPVDLSSFVRGNIARFAVAQKEQGWTAVSNEKDSTGRDDG